MEHKKLNEYKIILKYENFNLYRVILTINNIKSNNKNI